MTPTETVGQTEEAMACLVALVPGLLVLAKDGLNNSRLRDENRQLSEHLARAQWILRRLSMSHIGDSEPADVLGEMRGCLAVLERTYGVR